MALHLVKKDEETPTVTATPDPLATRNSLCGDSAEPMDRAGVQAMLTEHEKAMHREPTVTATR
jgi:hypothetical protein